MTNTPLMHTTYWLLIQDKNGIQRKLFTSEEAARKSAALRPSYFRPNSEMKSTQGGDLWLMESGKPWVLIESIDGEYNAKTRGLYT